VPTTVPSTTPTTTPTLLATTSVLTIAPTIVSSTTQLIEKKNIQYLIIPTKRSMKVVLVHYPFMKKSKEK
jgi:hypothetical protein